MPLETARQPSPLDGDRRLVTAGGSRRAPGTHRPRRPASTALARSTMSPLHGLQPRYGHDRPDAALRNAAERQPDGFPSSLSCNIRAAWTSSSSSALRPASSMSSRIFIARMCVARNVVSISDVRRTVASPRSAVVARAAQRTNSDPVRPRASAKASTRSHSVSRKRTERRARPAPCAPVGFVSLRFAVSRCHQLFPSSCRPALTAPVPLSSRPGIHAALAPGRGQSAQATGPARFITDLAHALVRIAFRLTFGASAGLPIAQNAAIPKRRATPDPRGWFPQASNRRDLGCARSLSRRGLATNMDLVGVLPDVEPAGPLDQGAQVRASVAARVEVRMRALGPLPDAAQALPSVGVRLTDGVRDDLSRLARRILPLCRRPGRRLAALFRFGLQEVLHVDEPAPGVCGRPRPPCARRSRTPPGLPRAAAARGA